MGTDPLGKIFRDVSVTSDSSSGTPHASLQSRGDRVDIPLSKAVIDATDVSE